MPQSTIVAAEPVNTAPATTSVLERMTLILDAFDASSVSLSLLELARRTGIPRSTVHRIGDQMVRLRWLAHSTDGYRLGIRALEVGGLAAGHNEIREVAHPLLHELAHRTGLVAHLAVLERCDVLYLDKAGSRFGDDLPSRLGGRMPAHATAVGKSMLSTLSQSIVNSTLPAVPQTLTQHTIHDRDALHLDLGRIRKRHGIALDQEEAVSGIACVAAPLPSSSRASALSLCGPIDLLDTQKAVVAVRELAAVIGRKLRDAQRQWCEA